MKSLVIIPTYNERENISSLISEILSLEQPLEILIVDDNSPDGTGKVVEEISRQNNNVKLILRENKLGLGSAYKTGFRYALASQKYNFIITMDADFSHQPRYIPELINNTATKNDITVGSRYVFGGQTIGWPFYRKFISFSANFLTHFLLKLPTHDATSGFRCYRKEVLESISLDTIRSEGYSFLVELLFVCYKKNYVIGEIPIIFENRSRGKSKISKTEIVRAIFTLARLWIINLSSSDL